MRSPQHSRSRLALVRTVLAVGLAAGMGTAALAPSVVVAGSSHPAAPAYQVAAVRRPHLYQGQRIRIVQANLRSGQPAKHFQADVAKVIRERPDVVTYNEVAYRHDSVLAPGAYRLWRTPGKYVGETAVAWNSSRWSLVAHGTSMVSHVRGRTAHQTVQWGIRYANWVTLRNRRDHRVVSVVAAHTAPRSRITAGLTTLSIRRIASLTNRLARRGPVFIGGDFNMGYHSRDYPAQLLSRSRLVPTYAVTGVAPPTGDYHGATIDYLFTRGISRFLVAKQRTMHLYSDHDALMADFHPLPRWTSTRGVSFPTGQVLSDATGTRLDQRVLVDTVISAINNAPRGSAVRLATRHLYLSGVVQALIDARKRGARVQVLTGGHRRTAGESRLARRLGSRLVGSTWAVRRDGALLGRPATRLLLTRAGTTDRVSITLPVALGGEAFRGSRRAAVVDQTRRGDAGLARLFARTARHH